MYSRYLRVNKQVRYFRWSPTTMTLLTTSGSILLMFSSINTGVMFSPPAVMINSLMRPVISRLPLLLYLEINLF